MKMNITSLSVEQVIRLHDKIITSYGGDHGMLNSSSLDFALDRIKNYSNELSIYEGVAIIMRGIIQDHPFVDGNKRTGLIVAEAILEENDLMFDLSYDDIEYFVIKVAKCEFKSIEELSSYIEKNSIEIWRRKEV